MIFLIKTLAQISVQVFKILDGVIFCKETLKHCLLTQTG